MCGGFTCTKNSLIALNVLYVVVSITLISVAAYAKFSSIVSSISLVSGIIACGVFLLLISVVGIVAASKHHQVLLFFYMVVLFLISIIQFSIACACLAMNEAQQNVLALQGWNMADSELIHKAEVRFHCCGYDGASAESNCTDVVNEKKELCCPVKEPQCCTNSTAQSCKCIPCNMPIQIVMARGLSLVGGIGLLFLVTEIIINYKRL